MPGRRGRWSVRDALPFAAAALCLLAAKLPTLHDGVVFIDEPYYLAEWQRLGSPGRFALSAAHLAETKWPVSVLPHALAEAVSHSGAMLVLHIEATVALMLAGVLLVAISRQLSGRSAAGVAAAAAYALFAIENDFTQAADLEHFQAPLVLLALRLVLRRPADLRHCAAAGLALGLAAVVKPPALVVVPALAAAAWLLAPDARARRAAALTAAAIAPQVALVLPYLLRPSALDALWFNTWELPRLYGGVLAGYGVLERARMLLAPAPLVMLAVVAAAAADLVVASVRARRVAPAGEWLLLATGALLLAAYVPGQLKPHYLIAVLPPLLLLGAHRAILAAGRLPRVAAVAAAAVLCAVAVYEQRDSIAYYGDLLREGGELYAGGPGGSEAEAVAAFARAHSRPGESIWVYYNAPEAYWLADRAPATRDPGASLLTHDFTARWLAVNLTDLERARPAVIAGIDRPRYAEPVPPLTEVPGVRELLARAYDCSEDAVPGATVCTRR